MIVRITGRLLEKYPDHAVVDVRGIGYQIWITLNTYESLPEPGYDATLLTYHQIREDSQELFGFDNTDEREIFKHLIAIAGIGAKTAVTILSSVLPDDLRHRIQEGDEEALSTIRGVGPKTARRILVEMKGKIGAPASKGGAPPLEGSATQAVQSLVALGYKHQEARRAVQSALKHNAQASIEDLVRAALRGKGY